MIKNQKGQTLVALLFFVMIGIITTASAVIILFTNLVSESKFEISESVRMASEAGGEKAIINLLRDPSYIGETMNIDNMDVIVSVTGINPKVISSIATLDDISRKIEISVDLTNNVLTVSSWKVIY